MSESRRAARHAATAPVRIREERPDDVADVREVLLASFATAAEARLVEDLRRDPAFLPHLAFVAVDGNAVVGHVLLTRLVVGDDGQALALAPLAVRPDRQGKGIGSALVEAALTAAQAGGERLVVVLGDTDYYGRFGFGPASEVGISTQYGDGPHVMALRLPQASSDGSGAPDATPRGAATYPAPFAAL